MGDGRIDLGCANVLMSQQFTDCFDRHPLRQRNGRSECMPRLVERNFFRDTRPRRNLVQAGVAPPVAWERENRIAFPPEGVVPQDCNR